MRNKQEILDDSKEGIDNFRLILEILLDMRDMLFVIYSKILKIPFL